MPTDLEESTRGPSAPLACQVIADIVGTETGALSGEQQWLSNGSVSKDSSIGHRIHTSYRSSSSSRPPVVPIVSVLISLASLSLMLSSISLTLTCVAVTTSARQRRVGAVEELALYKEQTKQTKNYSETKQNEAFGRGSAHRAQKKDSKTSVQHPPSSSSSDRMSDSKATSVVQSVPCQCAEISHVELGTPVAAHVSGAESDAGANSDITNWQNKIGVSDEILCREGRLVALEGGLYSVYSQLYIILDPDPEEEEERSEDRTDSLRHSVFRWNPADGKSVGNGEKAEVLMKRSWTLNWRRDIVEVSSYLAGVFNLSANDELTVRWSKSKSDDAYINPVKEITYFGMFKIQ